jgi:hypothetical protein
LVVEAADLIRQVGLCADEYHHLEQMTREAREHLYALVRMGIGVGLTYTEMGLAAGMSRTRVKQIVNGSP